MIRPGLSGQSPFTNGAGRTYYLRISGELGISPEADYGELALLFNRSDEKDREAGFEKNNFGTWSSEDVKLTMNGTAEDKKRGVAERKGFEEFYVLTLENGQIVGSVGYKIVHDPGETRFEIHRLVVDPSLQGTGLGRQLVNFAEGIAHERGFKRVDLNSLSDRATGFYQKLGYSLKPGARWENNPAYPAMSKELG